MIESAHRLEPQLTRVLSTIGDVGPKGNPGPRGNFGSEGAKGEKGAVGKPGPSGSSAFGFYLTRHSQTRRVSSFFFYLQAAESTDD